MDFKETKSRIGTMDELINVYREENFQDEHGANQIQKRLIKEKYWANVQYSTASEKQEDSSIFLFQNLTITCRFADFAEKDIVEHDGKFYDVFSVENLQRKSYQKLECVLQTEPKDA